MRHKSHHMFIACMTLRPVSSTCGLSPWPAREGGREGDGEDTQRDMLVEKTMMKVKLMWN